ncbi:MarC family protein [Lichenifustis flavocetrariae]|uniref:UPF0056 membrane protein n=1 Tax=Lichenifustis flavocetrariae TaxID=2949735 RepID=A0AA41YVP4_9HYPH|nr:MarC family protein [Lichenifustis flavocetrariae]MCW6508964.1 MarC family protein [Lichenifustis flavocetrariae]
MFEPWTILQDFLLAFSALFSIVNPPGSAFIFGQVTADRSHVQRQILARQVAVYAAAVMLVALWGGVYVLRFFGITVDALRIAGGLVVAVRAWELLSQPERNEARKQVEAAETSNTDDLAFFPLTMPFTTGPGTISVAIALGSNVPGDTTRQVAYVIGASVAALAVAILVWVSYRSADSLLDWLGVGRVRVLSRLFAFLLLCIGTQITLNGATTVLRAVLHP